MNDCDQELCPNWGGDGCICDVLDLPRNPVCGIIGYSARDCWHCEEMDDEEASDDAI